MELKRLLVLITVLVVYLCLGSVMFTALEQDAVNERVTVFSDAVNAFIDNSTDINVEELYNLLKLASIHNGLVYDVISNGTTRDKWDFGSGFGFAVSVVTTIGYGNLAPYTMKGKLVCVFYALVGIPISIIILSALGQKLAQVFARINKLKLCSQKPVVNKVVNMVIIITLGMVVMFVAPATVLHVMEDWGYMESLYFCFITLSTIGFGDLIIGIERKNREAFQIAMYVWILFGLAYLSLVIKYITDVLVTEVGKVERRTIRRLETELERIHDKTTNLRPSVKMGHRSEFRHRGKFKQAALDAIRLESDKRNVELVSVNHI
ncbi:potassium channel subfamily K member 16-like [Gigantopelta aegis]|uniref:potassium channel subfamily K member 16-like n=1 Tax=Gigantopelta aegis TaxID=1735272 RepID=UPI001B88C324|nr:potassium channel subfamily K member 16-like [Gigantopelta aegis]